MPDTSTTLTPQPADSSVYTEVREILSTARSRAAAAVNYEMVVAYWEIGRRIHAAAGDRAEYGRHLVAYLSERLTAEFGKGFTERNLWQMQQFYLEFPIVHALRAQLTWTHYRTLMRIDDQAKRAFYEASAADGHWSTRRLEREIHTLCYERSLAADGTPVVDVCSPAKAAPQPAIVEQTSSTGVPSAATTTAPPAAPFPVKDPYVLDFLGIPEPTALHESDLEQALIDHLQEFLLELGRGFAFVGRQVRVSSELSDYYVDLVFYHCTLKCYVLIDLKIGKLDPRDVGQMDFYVRLFDDQRAAPDDNPTVGLVLCAEGDRAVARYSALADGRNLFATRYTTTLPTEQELARALTSE